MPFYSDRALDANELALIRLLVMHNPGPGQRELLAQIEGVRACGGKVLILDLCVEPGFPRAEIEDGALDRTGYCDAMEQDWGGVLSLWVKDGYLDGLDFGWWTDEMPESFPPVELVEFWDEEGTRG